RDAVMQCRTCCQPRKPDKERPAYLILGAPQWPNDRLAVEMARAAEGVPIRGAGVYDQAMRYWPIVTFLCSALAYGGETLPDEARFGAADEVDMQERFNAQVMDAEELENLYLQSPVEISSSPASAM